MGKVDLYEYDIGVVGAGPAGMRAAIEAASLGARVCIIDKNFKAGGQLFKQIHKFFGSEEHYAGQRGFEIGDRLLGRLRKSKNIDIFLESSVFNVSREININHPEDNSFFALWISRNEGRLLKVYAKNIILSTGASEKPLFFEGWTLPGVMSAGAVQTLVNIYRVLPGKRILMVGSGNVGLIISYQLLQAGAEVVAVIEMMENIGGYRVHADKILANGVPILTSHILDRVEGKEKVEKAYICKIDNNGNKIKGSEKEFRVDIVCIAVGLEPYLNLLRILGCPYIYSRELGGFVAVHDENLETIEDGIFICGDLSGVEEATTAIEEGKLAGLASCFRLNIICRDDFILRRKEIVKNLNKLRAGKFGEKIKLEKQKLIEHYYKIKHNKKNSNNKGGKEKPERSNFYEFGDDEFCYTNLTSDDDKANKDKWLERELSRIKRAGVMRFALIECYENIPCNPCEKACPKKAIKVGEDITNIPVINYSLCSGCGLCIPFCPGLAIRVIDMKKGTVDLPYEFLPIPEVDKEVNILDSKGNIIGMGKIVKVRNNKKFNKTIILTVEVPKVNLFEVKAVRCKNE